MSNYKYHYFLVADDSPVRTAIQTFEATRLKQNEARKACVTKYSADGCYGNNRSVLGLVFDKLKPPAGWRKVALLIVRMQMGRLLARFGGKAVWIDKQAVKTTATANYERSDQRN